METDEEYEKMRGMIMAYDYKILYFVFFPNGQEH